MDLVRDLCDLKAGIYKKGETKNIVLPHGIIKNKKVQGKIIVEGETYFILGNYESGISSGTTFEDTPYTFLYYTENNLDGAYFFPSNTIQKFFKSIIFNFIYQNPIRTKYTYKKNLIAKRLLDNITVIKFLSNRKIYISTRKIDETKWSLKLFTTDKISSLRELEELFGFLIIIKKTLEK